MSGIDLCKENPQDNQIAIINALTGTAIFTGFWNAGRRLDDFLSKPVSLKTLFKASTMPSKKSKALADL